MESEDGDEWFPARRFATAMLQRHLGYEQAERVKLAARKKQT
jgi:hypothetical protein